jgi:hypothetical protein
LAEVGRKVDGGALVSRPALASRHELRQSAVGLAMDGARQASYLLTRPNNLYICTKTRRRPGANTASLFECLNSENGHAGAVLCHAALGVRDDLSQSRD